MFEANSIEGALQELIELSEAKQITEDRGPVTFQGLQDLYMERIINICDLLGFEKLYLGDVDTQPNDSSVAHSKCFNQRSKQLEEMPKDEMIRYLVFLELGINKMVHTDDGDLYGEVCDLYYGNTHQDAIDLCEQFNNFKK